ncbi:MAG: aminotransferase class III-fold pyridoxal phosphate-dependent enzyme [Anaerolineales bacterium]|nr:aminotransferase class III-fold pyridoxal phosphate-dependent enzyme [Anaerolineales bacterium]
MPRRWATAFPFPLVAGRDEIMAMVEPGRVAHGGTYCGNVVAATAAAATLEIIETQPVIETIFANGRRLMDGIHAILTHVGVPHVVSGALNVQRAAGEGRSADRLSQLY